EIRILGRLSSDPWVRGCPLAYWLDCCAHGRWTQGFGGQNDKGCAAGPSSTGIFRSVVHGPSDEFSGLSSHPDQSVCWSRAGSETEVEKGARRQGWPQARLNLWARAAPAPAVESEEVWPKSSLTVRSRT